MPGAAASTSFGPPQASPRGLAAFRAAPSLTQQSKRKEWEQVMQAVKETSDETDALQLRLQRIRGLQQTQRPASGSVVERQRRERERARARREAADQRRAASERQANEQNAARLAAQRKVLARAEEQLKAERCHDHLVSAREQGEAERCRSLAEGSEARAGKDGEVRWQRAADACLVRLLEARQADVSMRAEQRRRYAQMLAHDAQAEEEQERLCGWQRPFAPRPGWRAWEPPAAGAPARPPPSRRAGEEWLAATTAQRRSHADTARAAWRARRLQSEVGEQARRVEGDVGTMRARAFEQKLRVTAPSPRPSQPLEAVKSRAGPGAPDGAPATPTPPRKPRPSSAQSAPRRGGGAEGAPAQRERPYSAHQRQTAALSWRSPPEAPGS
eukprot:Transcript_15093.p1 GENE.Transcript_15093~~Transcript_15093.p1  ORF type:complete len:387 (-),score=101.95 Transcript_15093:83-1243(-)